MDSKELIHKLNWFYSLELNQVDLYMAQSNQIDDIYIRKALERASYVEQQHVDNITEIIKELGSKPTALGDVISPVLGKIGGNLTSLTGLVPMLKANILIERKAMSDYKNLLLKVSDQEIFNILWSNLIDEDFHTSWFSSKVQELEGKSLH
ncbi:ferritin-like domain-containing protein [Dethiobacter alkaliphilus]|uniref:Uncharacterized protein n=1 Tax=Dethiobacter alkaliphilus AHT 1 TaxID=555088 RepID=C0GCC6_DETAL|nr:ferritin-like domain-containing protein [Dethiobacter alkaliphilus]EEG78861.1 conserved hypothetical protein [Dethiobacter alkaliphilus AHT 1]